jgi:nitric oxide reductase activation protein
MNGEAAGMVVERAKRIIGTSRLRDLVFDRAPLGHRYPEWDCRSNQYRHDWCAVTEFELSLADSDAELDPGADRQLLRALARLGLKPEQRRRQADGEELDLTALVDFAIARATGAATDGRVFAATAPTAHDLGILILLDATGSTGESAQGSKVFDDQRRVVARLTAALDELGDRVATFAFYSHGRENVRFLRVKDFDERYDSTAQRRLATLEPTGFTRLGAAVRHGTRILTTEAGTSSTLLVVVGDGHPYDDGYEHRYAQQDSRRALAEANAAGVGCACLSIRASTDPDVIERVWGHVSHRQLEDPAELARHVTPLFRNALRDAAASRRPSHTGPPRRFVQATREG